MTEQASMKAVDVPVASVALREKRSSIRPSLFLFSCAIIASPHMLRFFESNSLA
jgi:hypothetical protein